MDEVEVDWDSQLDRCLLNAGAFLAEAPSPTSIEEACALANVWMNLADSWTRRQSNELRYAKWFSDGDPALEPTE